MKMKLTLAVLALTLPSNSQVQAGRLKSRIQKNSMLAEMTEESLNEIDNSAKSLSGEAGLAPQPDFQNSPLANPQQMKVNEIINNGWSLYEMHDGEEGSTKDGSGVNFKHGGVLDWCSESTQMTHGTWGVNDSSTGISFTNRFSTYEVLFPVNDQLVFTMRGKGRWVLKKAQLTGACAQPAAIPTKVVKAPPAKVNAIPAPVSNDSIRVCFACRQLGAQPASDHAEGFHDSTQHESNDNEVFELPIVAQQNQLNGNTGGNNFGAQHQLPVVEQSKQSYNSLSGEQPLGCFKDGAPRDLPTFIGRNLDPKSCFDQAIAGGFKYAGLQSLRECWAGNDVGTYGPRPGHECNLPCRTDSSRMCGAPWRSNVYTLPVSE